MNDGAYCNVLSIHIREIKTTLRLVQRMKMPSLAQNASTHSIRHTVLLPQE